MRTNKKIITCIFLLISVISVYGSWEQDLVEYYPQPVVSNGSADAYYPSVIFDLQHFNENQGDSIGSGPETYLSTPYYKMWFSNGSGIGFAYSENGINWTLSTVGITGLTNPHHVAVIFSNGNYYMWYWDTSQLYSHSSIRYADSSDGISWTNDQATTGNLITGVSPDWNRGSYGPCQVFYNNSASNSGTNPFDYTFYMYFDGTTGGVEETGLGYSANGTNWQLHGRVLQHGITGDWDSSYASRGTIARTGTNEWHMWYSGGQTRLHEGIGHATSSDGINWAKDPNNPIWHINDGISYRDSRTYTPWILFRPDRFSGTGDNIQFKGWFTARSGSAVRTICYLGTNQISVDSPPVAIITGSEQICPVPMQAELSAEDSYDNNGTITQYKWKLYSKPMNSNAVIDDPNSVDITFGADIPGEYGVSLRVKDNSDEWSKTIYKTIHASLGNAPELSIKGERNSEKSWLIIKDYFDLTFEIRESLECRMNIIKYLVYRKAGNGAEELIMELLPTQFTPYGEILRFSFRDKFFDNKTVYTYSIAAIDYYNSIAAKTSVRFDTL